MVVSVVAVELSREADLLVELALLAGISSLPHPLVKLVTVLAWQWAKKAYIQRLQDV